MRRGDDVPLERIDYYWGLFHRPERAAARTAKKRARFEQPNIPPEVQAAFALEHISELSGDHGAPGAGEPTEIDSLEFWADGTRGTVRVVNRGITLIYAETPALLRLHRFFSVLQSCI